MATPTMTWRRLSRRLGRDGNPLRRRSDLIEAWLLPAMITAFLALSPLVAGAAGIWVRADNAAARHAQLSWRRVPAVLLQAAAGPQMSDNGANTWWSGRRRLETNVSTTQLDGPSNYIVDIPTATSDNGGIEDLEVQCTSVRWRPATS
jgi:hypothetical protein